MVLAEQKRENVEQTALLTTSEVYTQMRLRNRDLMKSWKRKKEAYKDRKRAELAGADKKK